MFLISLVFWNALKEEKIYPSDVFYQLLVHYLWQNMSKYLYNCMQWSIKSFVIPVDLLDISGKYWYVSH